MRHSFLKPLSVTALVLSILAGAPAYAANSPVAPSSSSAVTAPVMHRAHQHVPHDMSIEARIASLHEKLKITAEQEEDWKVVADTMRDNEKNIHALIQERHANAKTYTAVDDLGSYEKIADAHAEGLKKLIPVFEDLYSAMSDDQKKNADKVFSRYEGHSDRKHGA